MKRETTAANLGQLDKNESTFILSQVDSNVILSPMRQSSHVIEAMKKRLEHECRLVGEARTEMQQYQDAHNRFIDLEQDLEQRIKRIRSLAATMKPEHFFDVMANSKDEISDVGTEAVQNPEELHSSLSLWQAIREYLLFAKEARVSEIQSFLDSVGLEDVSKQAIDSAVESHPNTFRVRKSGREKYIGLKKVL